MNENEIRYIKVQGGYRLVWPYIEKGTDEWHIKYESCSWFLVNSYMSGIIQNEILHIKIQMKYYNGKITESNKIKVELPFGRYRHIPFEKSKILTDEKMAEISQIEAMKEQANEN